MIHAMIFVAALLLVGVVLRQRFRLFRWLYLPSSVIAGMVGLAVVQLTPIAAAGSSASAEIRSIAKSLDTWPGFLIAVVFAGMLMERKTPSLKKSLRSVAREGLMVWIIVLGQTAVGLTATWLLIQPLYEVPNSFGMLIETGFAGGHGTAAAMGEVFKHPSINLESGLELGTLVATIGLVYGIVSGILWINVAIRLGWVKPNMTKSSIASEGNRSMKHTPEPIGYSAISPQAIDPLLIQLVCLTLAFGIGLCLQSCVAWMAAWWDTGVTTASTTNQATSPISEKLAARNMLNFPLFIYTLFGGLAVRRVTELFGLGHVVDSQTINRLTSTAMDVLVVAAIASLNLVATKVLLVPLLVLVVGGAIWCGVCLLVISRLVLPKAYWFQLGLINYGMSTGTTATGFVLLRMIDPELESGAAEDYAMAAPLSAPFIGGGILTVTLPLLVLQQLPIAVSAITMIAIVAVLIAIGIRWRQQLKRVELYPPT